MGLQHFLGVISLLLALQLELGLARGYSNYSDLPGPYCQKIQKCCSNRQDDCKVPILDSACYCDEFCHQVLHVDCCPDYFNYCKGEKDNNKPTEIRGCYRNGTYIAEGKTVQENCNKCTCEPVGQRVEMVCEEKTCLVDQEIINIVNYQKEDLGWEATKYNQFWGHALDEAILLRLGTLNSSKMQKMAAVYRGGKLESLPLKFDAREKWPESIGGVRDQGWCGSSWAVSTIDVASDRFGVMSKGQDKVRLSAQQLLLCNTRNQKACHGGYLDRAWYFIRKNGIVNEECYPWTSGVFQREDTIKCKIHRIRKLVEANCPRPAPANPRRQLVYKVGPAYPIKGEADIMEEIKQSGPVQAVMNVYHDFFHYKSGVYRHSSFSRREKKALGLQSVRILGWGEEPRIGNNLAVKYWLVANSWGTDWGENGLFRIVRGVDECGIESHVLAAWSKVIMSTVH